MNTDKNGDQGAEKGQQGGPPVGPAAATPHAPQEIGPSPPQATQPEVNDHLRAKKSSARGKSKRKPFFIHVTEDDELSSFERATVKFGFVGLLITTLSFIAAVVAAYWVKQQVDEMVVQNTMLSDSTERLRIDSNESSKTTAVQLKALQDQVKAAQDGAAALQLQITVAEGGTKALQGQLIQSRRSADIAARQLELTDRPWIEAGDLKPVMSSNFFAINFIELNLTGKHPAKYQVHAEFTGQARNVGGTPAMGVRSVYELYLPRTSNENPRKEERTFCKSMSSSRSSIEEGGPELYPQQPFDIGGGINGAITAEVISHPDILPPGDYISPILIGCINYQFESSSKRHQTQFVYRILHSSVTTQGSGAFFKVGVPLLGKDLQLFRLKDFDYSY